MGAWHITAPYRSARGFTILELLVVIALMAVLSALTMITLIQPQTTVSLDSAVEVLVADLRSQQTKSMVGDSGTGGAQVPHGVYVQAGSYTLFKGAAYSGADTDNFVITMDSSISLGTTLPSSQAVFAEASGELTAASTITVTNTISGQSKVISLNRLGVVVSVN